MTEPLPPDDATAPMAPVASPSGRGHVARVNLLPGEVLKERRRRRVALASVGALAIYMLALTVLYIAKSAEVDAALQERDTAEQRVAVLQAEADELVEYQALVDAIDTREALLTTAMADELSWARVFGDLALAFSRDASLTEIDAITTVDEAVDEAVTGGTTTPEATEPVPDTAEDIAEDTAEEPVAQITFTGYSVQEFAPGVAEVLTNFAETEGFFDSYLVTALDAERGDSEVTTFEGRVELNDQAYTRRYGDGVPEEDLQ